MRIGIDARFLTHPQVGGFKTYTENLINALSRVDDENDYVIYLDRQTVERKLPHKDNFNYRVVDGSRPLIGMPIREQIQLRRNFIRDRLDVIHFLCNTSTIGIPERVVITIHDTIQVTDSRPVKFNGSPNEYKQLLINLYSKWVILLSARRASNIITVSDYEKSQIIKALKIDPQQIHVTHLAPSLVFSRATQENKNFWRAEMRTRFNLYDRFILGIGYEPRKNIPLLINVFSQIATNHPDVGLVVIAAQPEKKLFYKKMAEGLNLNGRVMILDALPPRDLMVLFNLADVFVFPSERESFGLPILEAMACGTPVVSARNTSIPEIAENAALLIDTDDPEAMEDSITRVLKDQSFREKLVSRGIKRAAEFSWNKCALQTIDVYKQVVTTPQVTQAALERSSA